MFNRGGFPGQRPMGHVPMNQPAMNLPALNMSGMNMSGMNMPGMNMSGLGMPSMNQPNMNLSSMNHPGMNHQHMGPPAMNLPNMGLSGMNQPNMNLNRMNHQGMNQGGGMGFLPEMKTPSFGMRPMDNAGSFGGNADPIGMKPMPVRPPMHSSSDRLMGPQVRPQRFPGPSFQNQGQPRMPPQNQEIPSIVNRVLTHSSDRMMGKPKTPLQEPPHLMKDKPWDNLNVFGNVAPDMGMKPIPSGPLMNPLSSTQNRYTNESASSILESFGLSNEDLEELSRYPDDQLTPSNMPSILRDIRLRKINRPTPVPEQSVGRRPGGEAVPSKVIDYGHSSKYQFNDAPAPALSYDPPRPEQKRPPVPKETAPPGKPKPSPQKGMDNKIPTISGSRKPAWSSSKLDRSNNKTLVGEDKSAPMEVSVTVPKVDTPVISIQAVATPEVAAPIQAELKPTVGTGVTQVNYQKPAEPSAPGKSSWGPSKEDPQKKKRLPTPSMMNDYYAASPRIFPHICSLCNVECRHLKDWIKHQNNASHIESCRNLRQQYPDWNPHVLSSVNKKDEPTSKNSKSKSTSPRRSRRSGSRHRGRKSRSRSPRSSGKRSRSRSPRRPRYSPKRSHSPRRVARSPRRSRSPRRYRRSSHSNSPDKKAVDAAVQSFIESTKQKSGEKTKPTKPTSNGKKPPPKPANSSVKAKKPASTGTAPKKPGTSTSKPGSTSSSSSSSKKPSNSGNEAEKKPSSNSTTRKPSSTSSATRKPTSGSSSSKKPVVSTAAKKTSGSTSSGKKAQPAKQSGSSQKPPDSPVPTVKQSPSFLKKMIHVTNLPDSGYTDQDILKVVRPFGKVSDIVLIRSKNEAFIETNFVEAAAAAVKFSESTSVMINNQRIKMSLASSNKKARKGSEDGGKPKEEAVKASAQTAASKDAVKKVKDAPEKEDRDKKPKHDIEIVPGFIKCYKLDDPPLKESEKCVILISNLPEAQYTVDEISNLAKPFGGVNDILIVANHRKAYLELTSKNSVDSMIKFYNVFPTYLSGNLLSICVAHRYKDLKNEDLIFADLIEQTSYKITPTIYEKFVYLTNLPDKEVEESEILCVGLRFGKVEHHVLLSNKKKAILHLDNAKAAKAMHSFLSQFPCNIGENIVQCSLPSKTKLAEEEYLTYVEVEKQSTESKVEQNASEEPDKDQEKLSEPKDAEAKVQAGPPSPDRPSEMDVDAGKEELAPPASTKEDGKQDATFAPALAKPPSSKSKCYVVAEDEEEEEEDEDDDEEEAAEAPEAPETSLLYLQTEPEAHRHETHAVSHSQVSEELEILVSVESDEEECVEEHHVGFGTARGSQRVAEKAGLLHTETSAEEGTSNGPETEGKEATEGGKNIAEPKTKDGDNNDNSKLEEAKEPSTSTRREESKLKTSHEGSVEEKPNEEVSKSSEEKPGHPVPTKPEGGKTAVTMIRTTKYNAQKGEISVTVTMDGQKSTAKATESKKRTSREKGPSSHESSTPRSNSNRSSPADSASSHSKSGSSFPQKKSSGKYGSSQPERDAKDTSRTRDREARSSSRKDDRTRGSSSSRYSRSSKSSNRSPRAKEEPEETFPFNLDEFVTVDEIIEEQVDSKNKAKEQGEKPDAAKNKAKEQGEKPDVVKSKAKEQGEKPDAARKGKRKEIEPVPSDTKKPRVASTDSHEPSFVTLDEVGDEEENAGGQENAAGKMAQSLVTLDKVKAEDGSPASAKEVQMLMTLDEISDEDDAHDTSTGRRSTTEALAKDQLLTLDEVNEEDEEHTTPAGPSSIVERKLPEDTKVTEVKEEDGKKEPMGKPEAEVQQEAPANAGQKELLDEAKADDEELSFADIEHSFLTVDEVGEEEEETEGKTEEKPKVESRSSEEKDSSKASDSATPTKRGRPRKRPLQSAEDIKDSPQPPSPDTGKEAAPKTAPATAKPYKDSKRDSTSGPSDKPKSAPADVKPAPETPAKKTKLEPPPAEKTKLAPFNPSTPVGLEFLVPKTGFFCELCSLFYMDDSSKLKHCRSLRHYQAVEKQLANSDASPEGRSAST